MSTGFSTGGQTVLNASRPAICGPRAPNPPSGGTSSSRFCPGPGGLNIGCHHEPVENRARPARNPQSLSRVPRRVPAQARPEADPGALRRRQDRREADLRRAAARRSSPALRLPARAGRRARLVGRAEGRAARAGRPSARRPRRGPPARIRGVRRRDPSGPVRRGQCRDLGQRYLRPPRGEAERAADDPAARRAAAGVVVARSDAHGRQGAELAPDQAPRRRERRRGRAAHVRADARDAHGQRAARGRLGLRGEVRRLSGGRVSARRRLPARVAKRQRPDRALRRGCA